MLTYVEIVCRIEVPIKITNKERVPVNELYTEPF